MPPTQPQRGAVLAAVKTAARRLRRWPRTSPGPVLTAAARAALWMPGRDGETVLFGSNKETGKETGFTAPGNVTVTIANGVQQCRVRASAPGR